MLGKVQALEVLKEWNGLLGVENKKLNVYLPTMILAYILMACMQSFFVSFWPRKSSDVPDLLCQKHHFSLCPANTFPVGLSPVCSFQKYLLRNSEQDSREIPTPTPPLLFWFPSNNSVYNHKLSNSAICVSSKVWVWIEVSGLGSEQLAPGWPSW